jgi:large subunit ribosomal protein L23
VNLQHYRIVRKPHVTEKAEAAREQNNEYLFRVPLTSNKIEIGRAIAQLFKVKVLSVRTSIQRGKVKRMGRSVGKKSNWKKAIVRLADGNRIELYEGV